MNHPVLFSYAFDGMGGASPIEGEVVSQLIKDKQLAWVHLDANHPDARHWLEREINYLDPLIIEALIAEETRPRMLPIDEGALLILRGVNLNAEASPEDMVSVRLWIDAHRIISIRRRKLKAVNDIKTMLETDKGPKDSGAFVCMLINRLFARMEPVLSELDEATDLIEESVLETANHELRERIVQVRKQAIIFRRYMAPQRDAIGQLRNAEFNWLTEAHKRYLLESHNHVTRYVEDLDAIRERAQIIKDELANMLADKLNKNMYVLSVIAAIFLPLGFLTGLLGINVGGVPGVDNTDAFWEFSALLLLIVIAQIILFKRMKWF